MAMLHSLNHDGGSDLRLHDSVFVKLNQWVGDWRYALGLAHRGSTIGFHILWHTVELAMGTRLCLWK